MMGKRDKKTQDLAIPIDPAIEAQADHTLRRILARYDQPAPAEPPPELAARVLASLPRLAPAAAAAAEQRKKRRITVLKIVALVLLLGLCLPGGWGIFVDSTSVARLFGDTAAGIGYIILTLVLIAKPLVHSLLASGMLPLVAAVATLAGAGVVWWQLVEPGPPLSPLKPSGARM